MAKCILHLLREKDTVLRDCASHVCEKGRIVFTFPTSVMIAGMGNLVSGSCIVVDQSVRSRVRRLSDLQDLVLYQNSDHEVMKTQRATEPCPLL